MKTTLVKKAALAAAIVAGAGMAHGVESALQVVYCKATITGNSGEDIVSVTIPPTDGYFDGNGNPLTFWNVGNVPAGGVADSWHQDGGPGRFTARNAGNVGAYFYVTSGWKYNKFSGDPIANSLDGSLGVWHDPEMPVVEDIFGGGEVLASPAISPRELRMWYTSESYHLAFTTDTMAKVPTWHSLDHRYTGSGWSTEAQGNGQESEVAGYMGYVDAGDYLTFDLKFWAPCNRSEGDRLFTFCVEASAFPLWEHGRGVE